MSRRVKIVPPDSPFFSVSPASNSSEQGNHKIAMGMTIAYNITFTPKSYDDYFYDLIICTEREKFIVPITAIGIRPSLDFPDEVDFGSCPVKLSTKRFVLISNIGNKEGAFELVAPSPFFVSPKHGVLGPQETLQCTVGCAPQRIGVHEFDLQIIYDYGETVFSRLKVEGVEVDVGVQSSIVELLPTYVTRISQRSFVIYNESDFTVQFSIRAVGDADHEVNSTLKELQSLLGSDFRESGTSLELETLESANESGDAQNNDFHINPKVIRNRSQLLEAKRIKLKPHIFQNDNFSIKPSFGLLPPRGKVELVAEFRPTYAKVYESMAYVDVEGQESRIPITIKGRGLGPEAVFSYDALDVGDTFINTLHQYEVELQNRGKIGAQYQLLPQNTEFGSKFTFEPNHGSLSAGQTQIIKVCISSAELISKTSKGLKALKRAGKPCVALSSI